MLARRIVAISSDKNFAKQLTIALRAAGGAAEAHQDLEALGRGELNTSLLVLHLTPEFNSVLPQLLPRLVGDARVIVIIPKSNLVALVDVMQSSDRIVGVLIAETFVSHELTSLAARALAGDIFGLEKLIPWGTRIHSALVGDYQEKSVCISAVSEFAEMMGVRRKYRESIEQCLDEMLMNALYDAPVDDQGRQIFSDIPTKTRISLRVEQKVVVQYACDGKNFAVSVRDAFGTLERSTVLKYLHKCLHADQQIDRKTGGAGLGLYLMANSSTRVVFNVLPGVATEAVCTFNLESPKVQLDTFAFLNERIDAAGRLATGPSRLLPAGAGHPVERRLPTPAAASLPKGLIWGLALALLAILGLITAIALPKLIGPKKTSVNFSVDPAGATIEVEGRPVGVATNGKLVVPGLEVGKPYPVVAKLEGYNATATVIKVSDNNEAVPLKLIAINPTINLDSSPTGATVEIDGKEVGKTPLKLSSLPPQSKVSAILRLDGYAEQTYTLDVPGPGKDKDISVPMSVSADFASIVVKSTPPGAEVYLNGQLLAGKKTPTDPILVKAGIEHKVAVILAEYVAANVIAKPGRGEKDYLMEVQLERGVPLAIESNVEGKANVNGVVACRGMATPATCTVKAGDYDVDFQGAAGARRRIKVGSDGAKVSFRFGFVEAGPGKTFLVGNGEQKRIVAEEGKMTVTVMDGNGTARKTVVTISAGQTVKVQ
jgi:PEGA domain